MATRASKRVRTPSAIKPKALFRGEDHGRLIALPPDGFAPEQRGGGWGWFAESFISLNRPALEALDLRVELGSTIKGVTVGLLPGGRTGAVPLRSPQTGKVVGGVVVHPRFGWPGMGRVLQETGWAAMPEFLKFPLVPGSGRDVPPWVLAIPVLARVEALLKALPRGYQEVEAYLQKPRGRMLWTEYVHHSLARGRWDQLPCRYSDLTTDPVLRQNIRWVLERLHEELVVQGPTDPLAYKLGAYARDLVRSVSDVQARQPRSDQFRSRLERRLGSEALLAGLEAMSWVVEERGLGGGQERSGLAWTIALDRLWEAYVEADVRREAALFGGEVRVGRLGETVVPIRWTDPLHRSLGHLVPDIVVRHGRQVHVVDAKYKAHLAELDEVGWRQFTEEAREAHRADIHQVLAYAGLFDADHVTTTLVYPMRLETWESLRAQEREISVAELSVGGRIIRLELRGLPFGRAITSRG